MLKRVHEALKPTITGPLWTQDEAIVFEYAKEAIGQMIAICSSLTYEEEKKPLPNLKRIKELRDKMSFLGNERRKLHLNDKYNIARVRKEYGSKIRAYECEGGECPV